MRPTAHFAIPSSKWLHVIDLLEAPTFESGRPSTMVCTQTVSTHHPGKQSFEGGTLYIAEHDDYLRRRNFPWPFAPTQLQMCSSRKDTSVVGCKQVGM